jgi:ATP-dependent DNA helicase RecQ
MDRFNLLQSIDNNLFELVISADNHLNNDPNITLIKLRQFGEVLANLCASKLGIVREQKETQQILLNRLHKEGGIRSRVIHMFHQIKNSGNNDREEAEKMLEIAHKLSIWFAETFCRDNNSRLDSSTTQINSSYTIELERNKDTSISLPANYSFLPVIEQQKTYIDQSVLLKLTYVDLEVDSENKIFRIGLTDQDQQIDTNDITGAISKLLPKENLLICGHNFRRFDYPHLLESYPDLSGLLIIDTLELSILAFPLEYYHKLNKEYKLSEFAKNNPLEDALATKKLLQEIVDSLNNQPAELYRLLVYLLSCGHDPASKAYSIFFDVQDLPKPNVNLLPQETIEGIDTNWLSEYLEKAHNKEFDERICVAGILAWNYEIQITKNELPFSGWLTRFPQFFPILDSLRPLQLPLEFTYQSYLRDFGVNAFRDRQEDAIQSILARENPLIIMATGSGKSLCYQLPAFMLSKRQKGLTVVISPLQALMADQIDGLTEKGLDFGTFINGNISPIERRQRLEQIRNGEKDLLYISAEQLRSPSIRALLQDRLPSFIVFDEAHCISQWGHDFRPDYRYAPKFIRELYQSRKQQLPIMAFLTATATEAVRQDIKTLFSNFDIPIHREICSSSKRDNLTYQIIPCSKQDKESILVAKVTEALSLGGAVLIYTMTRKDTKRLADLLNQNGIEAQYYHGKIPKDDKKEILEQFKQKKLNVVVATCAFGMGIDRRDVRAVIHHTMSGNLEGYVQEAGRAGRDRQPATCTLLFDHKDADTAFFLQSLNQLSEPELRNVFLAVRELRNQIFSNASEDYFWVTTNEIFQVSDLDHEFASDTEQLDTKIKVALHYLETFNMIEREENQSSFIQFELLYPTPTDSLKAFDLYAYKNNLSAYRIEEFHRLILAMHLAKSYCQIQNEPYPLEKLSDNSGISIKELKQYVKELQRAEVCTTKIPTTILITKDVRGNAKVKYDQYKYLEEKITEELLNLFQDREEVQVNCRALATKLDPEQKEKLTSSRIIEVIEGWSFLKWIEYRKIRSDVIKISKFDVLDCRDRFHILFSTILEVIYEELGSNKGKNLRVTQDLVKLLDKVKRNLSPQEFTIEELEKAIAWMHGQKIIRLADGANLFYQSMKVKVIKGEREDKIKREYPKKVKPHYDEQTRRTHIMIDYAEQHKLENFDPQQYIEEYFSLTQSEFFRHHPNTSGEAAIRPVTQEDYDRIISPLNAIQREIVLCEAPAISVIAGPGSGKTRTIVHRIAYLVKVKRVDPSRIIALAYNRNAVRELRQRLQNLVGEMASRLRVYTFHGLALAILGRTVEQTKVTKVNNQTEDPEEKFTKLIKDACNFLRLSNESLETGDENVEENRSLRIAKLLGNCEYIFVDEYQDVAEYEYELVKLIAGLPEDKSLSVATNICVIGDDDQNIYEWRGTSTKYIRCFQAEYQAKQFLLTENYRSTEPIIAAANRLIQNNKDRLKSQPDQQVKIDSSRVGQGGLDVYSIRFQDDNYQAGYINQQVRKWIDKDGIKPGDIAILARNWDFLDKVRALLEHRSGIPTYSLKGEDVKLVRNYTIQLLITDLEKNLNLILPKEKSVKAHFEDFFARHNRSLDEPTVKKLIKIGEDIDKERGYGFEDLATSIAMSEILTSIYEFNETPEVSIDPNAVLVTSCHGAKGLEFRYVILIADGFDYRQDKIEAERRLFYVAMTRAKEKLLLVHSQDSRFVLESGSKPYPAEQIRIDTPKTIFYADLTPGDVHLGFSASKENQHIIKALTEGDVIDLKATQKGDNWTIRKDNIVIGLLSHKAAEKLRERRIEPRSFVFQPREVRVRNIYRQMETNQVTGEILEEWYVVIPQIRVCRD